MIDNIRDKRGFFTLLELLLVVAVILILCYVVAKVYFARPFPDEKTRKSSPGRNIDASGYKGILDSSKKKIKDVNRQTSKREKMYKDLE